ncbi:MAG TPA: tetratricopeptide repeat protein [Patescibacteria group bacterium]|nr:tetratricopeptide repeat protein [Patescibacteria group bacterium]
MIPRTDPAKVSVPLRTKLSLVILGFFLFLVFLEAGLRLGGFVIVSLQESRNQQSIRHEGTYRIMCLGESTTAGQYPPFLETILNRRHIGIQFSVIDKGRGGTRTPVILAELESNLNQYHPHMVITMMGINDAGLHIPHETTSTSKIILFFTSLRTYKLTRLLWLHIVTKAREAAQRYLPLAGPNAVRVVQASSASTESSLKRAIELNPQRDRAYVELGRFYRDQGQFSQAEDAFKKATELNQKNDRAYLQLGENYRAEGKFSQAEDAFKKAIELNPGNDEAHVILGWFYRKQGKLSQAEYLLRKAAALNPKSDDTFLKLGWLYQDQNKLPQAEDAFKQAIVLNPRNAFRLGSLYHRQGKLSQVEAFLKKAIEVNSEDIGPYIELGRFYRAQGKFSQAEAAFQKAIELNPRNERSYGALAILYKEMGKPELSKEYAKKRNSLESLYYYPATVKNYRKLKEILDRKGIRLVCVQYPMRAIEPLRMTFESDGEGVIFVDNEKVFKDAVRKGNYATYFVDMFAGDFGHCTDKGNELLAENIANTIVKEVFHK